MRPLDRAIKKLKEKWLEQISSILDGSCGCVSPVTLIYEIPVYNNCNTAGINKYGIPGQINQTACDITTVEETLDLAVFYNEKAYVFKNQALINESFVRTVVNLENKEKLIKIGKIKIDGVSYRRDSVPEPCGFGPGYEYYSIIWIKQ